MSLEITKQIPIRVHIIPVGFEKDRVVIPAIKMNAEKVILMVMEEDTERGKMFVENSRTKLKSEGIDVEDYVINFFNLNKNMEAFNHLIKEHKNDDIYINISTGSKIQALAALFSAMAAKNEGIRITTYYVEPEIYGQVNEPMSTGIKDIISIPIFPLPQPSNEIKEATKLLLKHSFSKEELGKALAEKGVLGDKLKNAANDLLNEKIRISIHSTVQSKIIVPMLKEKYIVTEKKGRNIIITLTEFGREASNLFTE